MAVLGHLSGRGGRERITPHVVSLHTDSHNSHLHICSCLLLGSHFPHAAPCHSASRSMKAVEKRIGCYNRNVLPPQYHLLTSTGSWTHQLNCLEAAETRCRNVIREDCSMLFASLWSFDETMPSSWPEEKRSQSFVSCFYKKCLVFLEVAVV